MYSKEECSAIIRKESILRAAMMAKLEANLKNYESALLLELDSEKFRLIAHDVLDALMDGQVRAVNTIKNTKFE